MAQSVFGYRQFCTEFTARGGIQHIRQLFDETCDQSFVPSDLAESLHALVH
jgi:hypothetical protein